MRLRMPNIRHIESDDGSRSLTYEGLDMAPAQAGGGAVYILRISEPEGLVEIRATVQSTTSFRAEEQAKAEGLDLMKMGPVENGRYINAFGEKFGRSSSVIAFSCKGAPANNDAKKVNIVAKYAEIFAGLFLNLEANFKFNNTEYPNCGDGCYPDSVEFELWGENTTLNFQFSAEESLNV